MSLKPSETRNPTHYTGQKVNCVCAFPGPAQKDERDGAQEEAQRQNGSDAGPGNKFGRRAETRPSQTVAHNCIGAFKRKTLSHRIHFAMQKVLDILQCKKYNVNESEVKQMSPKTGRPKIENPKNGQITVRLDKETMDKLDELTEKKKASRSEIVREGIEKIYEDEKE